MEKAKTKTSGDAFRQKLENLKSDKQFANDRIRWANNGKEFILRLFRLIIIVGICYVILGPILGIISSSFFSDADNYNPMVYLIPQEPTLERYKLAIQYLNYWGTMGASLAYSLTLMLLQVLVCSMVGYGFARFQFPFKNLLFGCVVIMIVVPTNTIMLPLYMTFAKFDVFGIIKLITGSELNLLSTPVPMYIMTLLGCGLRSGLYIYIFNQFSVEYPRKSRRRRSWTAREPGTRTSGSCSSTRCRVSSP